MEQIKLFIEKAQSDNELMKKLVTLGAEEIAALAAEHGFTVTKEDVEKAASCGGDCSKCGELSEDELNEVSGGYEQRDRWDEAACKAHGRTRYECVGLMGLDWCRYYKREEVQIWPSLGFQHTCTKGAFNYKGNIMGDPPNTGK